MSDETYLRLNWFVNRQRCRIRRTENPRVVHPRETPSLKRVTWSTITSCRLLDLNLFRDNEGNTMTLAAEWYPQTVWYFLKPTFSKTQICKFNKTESDHTLIGLQYNSWVKFLPRDSSPRIWIELDLDYFLREYLKGRMYSNNLRTIENFRAEVRGLTPKKGPHAKYH